MPDPTSSSADPVPSGPIGDDPARARRRRSAVIAATLALLLACLLVRWGQPICAVDECTLLAEAKRMLEYGEHPHRDFFDFQGVANLYLAALVFRVWGSIDPAPLKLFTWAVIVFGGWLLVTITRRHTNRLPLMLLPAAIYAGYLAQYFPFPNHHWFSSTMTLLFLAGLGRYLCGPGPGGSFACGAAAAASLVFLLTEGVVNLATGALAICVACPAGSGSVPSGRPLAKALAAYSAGMLAIFLPVVAWYAHLGALGTFLEHTLLWPFANYSQPRGPNDLLWLSDLPTYWASQAEWFRSPVHVLSCFVSLCLVLLPILTVCAGIALWRAPSRAPDGARFRVALGVLLFHAAGIYASEYVGRPSYLKALFGSVPFLPLAALVLDRLWTEVQPLDWVRRAALIAGTVAAAALALTTLHTAGAAAGGKQMGARWVESAALADNPTAAAVNQLSAPGDRFFAHSVGGHLYYLVHARPATRFTLTMANYLSPDQIREIVEELLARPPRWIAIRSAADVDWLAAQDARLRSLLEGSYGTAPMPDGWTLLRRKD